MSGSAKLAPLAQRRVLVVEDEHFLADDMMQVLEAFGAEVVGPAPTRATALALLGSEEGVDAAVLDIHLQGEDVFPVADALIERGIPFVFATGYDQSVIPAAYGGVRRWEKPFDPTELARALSDILHPR